GRRFGPREGHGDGDRPGPRAPPGSRPARVLQPLPVSRALLAARRGRGRGRRVSDRRARVRRLQEAPHRQPERGARALPPEARGAPRREDRRGARRPPCRRPEGADGGRGDDGGGPSGCATLPGALMADESSSSALPPIAIPAFSGPLDLLLHLIRINEVSITDIPISEITEQYTAYLDAMRELDLDVASDYIALAAELIYIKSKMLLPQVPGEPVVDPRAALAQRLLEYERFKRSAETLHAIDPLRGGLWPRPDVPLPRPEGAEETLEVSLFDLIETFRRVTDQYRLAHPPALPIHHPRFSLRDQMIELLARLDEARAMPLLEFLGKMQYRAEAVTAFLACLELVRLQVVRVFQPRPFAEIHASRTDLPFTAEQIRDTYTE